MELIKDKRGIGTPRLPNATLLMSSKAIQILLGIIILIALLFLMYLPHSYCNHSSFTITDKITKIAPSFLEKPINNFFEMSIAGKGIGVRMDERSKQITNLLGFGKTSGYSICIFIYDLEVGLLAGLWIYLLYLIYIIERRGTLRLLKTKVSQNTWLTAIGGAWYKILIIGLAYAILMQIPFLNAGIDLICFDFLVDGFWFDVIIRSFLIAFYIGVGPTAYSEYKRYKIKKAYQYAVLRKKYESQAQRAWFEN